ncbi:NEL-type E3 ubiquitin ligase domain-containing protein [Rhabdochlamydiaceae symbiont of Dictyostelium giganteum]|uniref:NEL-type E3 ubiquitin ligase domain-containing protein n=1 Tax=Rhabdochlamydiaceae symbiont of Dictyostelium giganteum TaxID=3342349 RepID=UPI00384E5BE6
MNISISNPSHASTSYLEPRGDRQIFLAEELNQLTSLDILQNKILIQGNVEVNSSNICSFIFLRDKEVEIDGLFTCQNLPFSHSLSQEITDCEEQPFCFLPHQFKVKGNVIFSHISEPFSFPEFFEIEGNFTISYCKALKSLPRGLKVKGSLNLFSCENLAHLSEETEIGNELDLSDCEALITLPKQLKVGGSFDVSYCTGLTHLPEDLEVKKDLHVSNCPALRALSKGLKVKGSITLTHCPAFTHIFENFETEGHLSFYDCPVLTTLPKGLKVKKTLDLSYCTELTHLPEDLEIGGDLILSNCIGLMALPHQLKLGGDLGLRGCYNLSFLPSWIATLGRCVNRRIRAIDLTETRLSSTLINRLQEDTRHVEGMQFYFSEAAGEEYTAHFETLSEALEFWQEQAEDPLSLEIQSLSDQLHQTLTSLQDYQNLLRFLTRLTRTADYLNLTTRVQLARRVLELILVMAKDNELCSHYAFLIHQGLSSCDDRIMATLEEINLDQKLRTIEHESVTAEELRDFAKGFFFLEELNKKIRERIKTLRFVDEVEVYMAFHIKLQHLLNLPLDTKEMIFRRCVAITDEEIENTGKEVLQTLEESLFEAFLANWDPWKRYQRKISVIPWQLLPIVDRQLLSEDICPYLQDVPTYPVLYKSVVYDYDAFIRRYIEEGVDLHREKVQIDQLFRLNTW